MGLQNSVFSSPEGFLGAVRPDDPVYFFAPKALYDAAKTFQRGFGGLVSYALKANPDAGVIDNLLAAGINAFDVASPREIAQLRRKAPDAALHYNNPVRSQQEIDMALAAGVRSFSVDRMGELEKLLARAAQQTPLPRPRPAIEVSVRLKLPVSGAAYDFGAKFGATPEVARDLLRRIAAAGLSPSMTFHPGTQCTDPAAWQSYIKACADIARAANVRLSRLNVGGGFPAHRQSARPDLGAIFTAIATSIAENFGPNAPALVCEPGRALVAEAFTLATRIKAIGPNHEVFLNDGIYGGLAEFLVPDMAPIDRISVIRPSEGRTPKPATGLAAQMIPRTVFGPTCDSLDMLPGKLSLPRDLIEGDYLLFCGAGAYGGALATGFNGYGRHRVVTLPSGGG